MNTLVVYDSQYGNTERIAEGIGETLSALGRARVLRVDSVRSTDLENVEMLFIGCPTQGWRPTAATQTFLGTMSPEALRDIRVACFDTRFQKPRWMTGSAAGVMSKRLRERGIALSVAPESFFVDGSEGPLLNGEVERAKAWAMGIARQVVAHPVAQS
ncbi:MAG TPA: flavodoxin domain-containing protein [Ktedonobacterales bacterium]|jgi:flavodoxin|nr:flavodoxin domain-containing protein [Ktedonobacterales bacterium]